MSAPEFSYEQIVKMIDHSLLNPVLTTAELEAGCKLAAKFDTASVCILPYYTAVCHELLAGTSVYTSTTVGFPHGGHRTNVKLFEAEQALKDGAQELDAVINISKTKSADWEYIEEELRNLTNLTHTAGARIKVIFENFYLVDDEKIRLCRICGDVGADWVKTSTGYAGGGANIEDLMLMRRHAPPHVQVKAAGGVRDLDTLLKVRSLGVTRVGSTRTAQQLNDCKVRLGMAVDVPALEPVKRY